MRRLGLGLLLLAVTPFSARAQETVEYYGTDSIGSVRVVFDQSGGVTARTDYLPFGEELFAPGPMPKERFTGQERDGEAGADYFHARMLQPRSGRFSAVDTIVPMPEAPQSWNRYSYVANDPLRHTDPTGLMMLDTGALSYVAWVLHPTFTVSVTASTPYVFTQSPPIVSGIPTDGDANGSTAPQNNPNPPAVNKSYPLTTACTHTADEVMAAVESNFASFANYSAGPFNVTFSPPAGMGVGSTIPISVGYFGITQNMGVRVQSMSSQSMTFNTLPGGDHLLYPASITFSASSAGSGLINFSIDLSGEYNGEYNKIKFRMGGGLLENAQWRGFLANVARFCGRR